MRAGLGGMLHVPVEHAEEIRSTAYWLGLYPGQLLAVVLVFVCHHAEAQAEVRRHVRLLKQYRTYRRMAGTDFRIGLRAARIMERIMLAEGEDTGRGRSGARVAIVRGAWTAWKEITGLVRPEKHRGLRARMLDRGENPRPATVAFYEIQKQKQREDHAVRQAAKAATEWYVAMAEGEVDA